jgi:hypothetical protein
MHITQGIASEMDAKIQAAPVMVAIFILSEMMKIETPETGKTWSRFMSRLWQKIDTRQPFLCSMW